jgi:hypothetical protein
MRQFIVVAVRMNERVFYNGDSYGPNLESAKRFGSIAEAAALLTRTPAPEAAEVRIIPAPAETTWTVEDILAREG